MYKAYIASVNWNIKVRFCNFCVNQKFLIICNFVVLLVASHDNVPTIKG